MYNARVNRFVSVPWNAVAEQGARKVYMFGIIGSNNIVRYCCDNSVHGQKTAADADAAAAGRGCCCCYLIYG